MSYAINTRIHHLKARLKMLEKLEEHIGTARMGDYLSVGDQCFWLSEDEVYTVIDALKKSMNEEIERLQ